MKGNYFNRTLVGTLCAVVVAFLSACPPSTGKKTVAACSIYNGDKTLCQGAIDKDGKNCQYDDITQTCFTEEMAPSKITGQAGLNKYYLYQFGEVDPTNIQAAPDKIHSAVASGNGFVYVAGRQGDETGVMDRTSDDGATWEPVGLKGKYVDLTGKNTDALFDSRTANAPIDIVGSLHHGIIVSIARTFLIGLIEDADKTKVSKSWAFSTAKIGVHNRRPLSFFEIKKGGIYFVYAGNLQKDDGISYYQTDPAPKPDYTAWRTGYSEDSDPMHALKQGFTMFANRPNGGMLLGSEDGQIYEMEETALGDAAPNEKKLLSAGPKVQASYLQHGADKNSEITCMLLVENKYLLIGFRGTAQQGGLFYGDITVADAKDGNWQHTDKNITVTGMVLDRNESARAVIATDQGVLIFYKGAIQEIVPGEKFIKTALVAANKGDITDKSTAKTGFIGALLNDKLKGVAQGKRVFFLPSEENVQTLKILSNEF